MSTPLTDLPPGGHQVPTGAPAASGGREPRGRGLLPLGGAFAAGAGVTALVLTLMWGPPGGDDVPAADDGVSTSSTRDTEGSTEPEDDDEADAADLGPLAWAPPTLEDPETIEVTDDTRGLKLEDDQDYIIEMPDEPITEGGIGIIGGRNVVLIGGEIRLDEKTSEGERPRALFLRGQTGTVHIEGLLMTGEALGEGINLDQRDGAVVQLQNIRVEMVRGEQDGNHADVIQSWAGPRVLRIDRLTGYTDYQGFFLLPNQFGDQDEPELFDFRNIDLHADEEEGSGYLLWRDNENWPIRLENVWVAPRDEDAERRHFLWARGDDENRATWDEVNVGTPPGGPFVPEDVAGVDYTSPGYADEQDS